MEFPSPPARILALCVLVSFVTLSVEARSAATRRLTAFSDLPTAPKPTILNRNEFPSDFLFGVSTAAPQIEGSPKADGRGPSVWDDFVEKHHDEINGSSNWDTVADSYKRYKEDVQLIKDLGVDVYRFSLSWTRILPNGTLSGGINQAGLDHYNSLIDELLKNGIKPFVTLYHFDSPQTLQDQYAGFLSRSMLDDFIDYAELCFKAFGDRVKNWITINEPYITAQMGHDWGIAPPKRCSKPMMKPCAAGNSSTEPYIVSHNMLLAHAAVVKLYREKFQAQGGQIGISLVGKYLEPYDPNSEEDKAAIERVLDFELGWYMEPLVFGDYPQIMKDLARERLPIFTAEEKKLVKGSFDFIGINYYTSRFVQSLPINLHAPPTSYSYDSFVKEYVENKDQIQIGPKAPGSKFIYSYPDGLLKLLEYIKKKYRNPKILITENGWTQLNDETVPVEEALKDGARIDYVHDHLLRVRIAINSGVNVKAYMYWNLLDDFEWNEGYVPRFGLYYVDYKDNLKRIPKDSAKWFANFLRPN